MGFWWLSAGRDRWYDLQLLATLLPSVTSRIHMPKFTASNICWFVAYLAMMGLVIFGLMRYRASAMKTYSTNEASAEWQQWRSAAEQMSEEGPVTRRPPKATEPPALLLMRDHFPACLGISLLLSSCLFVWFMICARGAFRPVVLHGEE